MCCNKEAVNGACFWIFYSVHLCGRGKKLYSSVWRLRCAISMELLTLVCVCNIFTSTADLVLPRCFLMADWTCQRRTKHSWLIWRFDIVLLRSSLSLSHLHAILEGPCSIGSFYDVVHDLHCCKELSDVVWFGLCSTEGWCCSNRLLTRLQQTCIAATSHLTHHAFVFVPYDHCHKCTHTYMINLLLLGLLFGQRIDREV